MSDNITKLTPFDASKRALEGTTNFRENANYSWAWIAQHTQEVNKLIDDLNIYKNGLKDILSEYVLENLEENVVNNAISKKINISDIQDVLDSTATDKPLSANQGRILKELINHINQILTSDDTSLDELQEIVNFIKQNKSILNTLSISNIAGLQEALENASSLPIGTVFGGYEDDNPNYIVAFGGTFKKANYPELWDYVQAHPNRLKTLAQWDTEATANSGICDYYCEVDILNFRVPSLDGSTIKFSSRAVGSFEGDAIRNITGQFQGCGDGVQSGAFSSGVYSGTLGSGGTNRRIILFSASNVVPTAPRNRVENTAQKPLIVATKGVKYE